jgi:hypothetical protein
MGQGKDKGYGTGEVYSEGNREAEGKAKGGNMHKGRVHSG